MKSEAKAFSNSTFSVFSVTRAPTSFSSGPPFFLVFRLLLKYLMQSCLLSLTSFARFSSRWALAFLVASLHALTVFLNSSEVAYPSCHIP